MSHILLSKKEKKYCIPLNDTRLTRRMQTKVSATKQNIPIGKKTRLRISGLALCSKRYLPPGQAQAGVKREIPHLRLRNQSLNDLPILRGSRTQAQRAQRDRPPASSPLRLLQKIKLRGQTVGDLDRKRINLLLTIFLPVCNTHRNGG